MISLSVKWLFKCEEFANNLEFCWADSFKRFEFLSVTYLFVRSPPRAATADQLCNPTR